MSKKKNKNKTTSAESELLMRKQSFQEWLPISDVENGFIKTKNFLHNEYYPVIQLGDTSINLMTPEEQYRFAKSLEIALSSLTIYEYQILVLPLPYNLETWNKSIDKRRAEIAKERQTLVAKQKKAYDEDPYSSTSEAIRADIQSLDYYDRNLEGQKRYVSVKLADGSILSKKAFFIPKIEDCETLSEYQEATNTIVAALNERIPNTYQCNSQEVRNVLFTILNPLNKSYVKTPARQAMPQMNWGSMKKEEPQSPQKIQPLDVLEDDDEPFMTEDELLFRPGSTGDWEKV